MNKIYGLTLDDVSDYPAIVEMLQSLPRRISVRIVIDPDTTPDDYRDAVTAISQHADIMMCVVDSTEVKKHTPDSYREKVVAFYVAFHDHVAVWEVANEINGDPDPEDNWVGENAWEKVAPALRYVKSCGGKTAVTNYLEPTESMFRWDLKNIAFQDGELIDVVLVSYYRADNDEWEPDWQAVIDHLGMIFPNAELGVGECGDDRSDKQALSEFQFYYEKFPAIHPRFIGGFYFWYRNYFIGKHATLLPELRKVLS